MMIDLDKLKLRKGLKPGENKRIREITERVGFFYPYEVDVAEELALICLSEKDKSEYLFLSYEYEGKIVAYTCYGPTACTVSSYDLYWIVTDVSLRGKGIGQALMDETEKIIKAAGGRRVYAETSSRELYTPTRKFYEKCGYKIEGIFKDFYAEGDDKVVYVKKLW
jgi:Acetyltransferases